MPGNLLDHSRNLAGEMGVLERGRFFEAPEDDPSALGDGPVDAGTARPVVIYGR
ncbi:hypothetical protein [Rubrobacter indicoceani]|uniref:hypothetical protein n=1 Tax=Rubrobacter indicoceani TaxID=2051957 RepID=UPI0013C41E36|nr:hypothetical protein [Rubrobacter indicoceani]